MSKGASGRRAAGKRRAEPAQAAVPATEQPSKERGSVRFARPSNAIAVLLWSTAIAVGLVYLAAAALDTGPGWFDSVGAVVIATALTWGLTVRTGGRPFLFSLLVLVVAVGVVVVDNEQLSTGAAVVTAAMAAMLGVMATVPAVRIRGAIREPLVAAVIAFGGSFAAIGFDPTITVVRYQYAVLALALIGTFVLVYRLGAGLHGLGRRGFVIVIVGGLVLAAMLAYAGLLRNYGSESLRTWAPNLSDWSLDHLHGYPRPIEALLGVPALMWGAHMRARRRQGWWVCAFGVAFTAPAATTLANPGLSVLDSLLTTVYSLVVGIVVGFLAIRVDLLLTGPGPRGAGSGARAGRRAAREAEEASAVRPEPTRTRPLL